MNNVSLVGNLVRDVELRYTKNGTPAAHYTIAINGYNDSVDYVPCITFGSFAGKMDIYVGKGNKLGVKGHLSSGSYEKNGIKISTLEVVTDEVEIITWKDDQKGE